jgi:hypothetical protein
VSMEQADAEKKAEMSGPKFVNNFICASVKESHGGRGYAYQVYSSYTLDASKLKRLELK